MRLFQSIKSQIFKPKDNERAIEVIPRVFALNFPSEERKEKIKAILSHVSGDYKVWNVSEYTYDSAYFEFNVADYSRPGYPCPPLQDLLIITREMGHWLDSRPTNQLFIHCQQNFGRTTLVLACLFLSLHIEKDMGSIESLLSARLNSTLLGNQRLYLKYFESCAGGIALNRHPVYVKRVTLSEKPFIRFDKTHLEQFGTPASSDFKPYIQVFLGKHIVYNSLQKYR